MSFRPVPIEASAAELVQRWEAEGSHAWAEGDELTLVCRKDAAGVVLFPVFQMPMQPMGDGLFAARFQVDRLDEALISYMFWPTTADGYPAGPRPSEPDGRYRGPNGPPEAPSNKPPTGTVVDHAVESDFLGGPRTVSVYRPPGHTRDETLPVIYGTDGQMITGYVRRLDAAIELGLIPRVVLAAAHAAPADQRGNFRALEYLMGFDDRHFDAHQRFFGDELPAWVEATFGVASDREHRAVFGCSDGGGHALATAQLHPDRYGHVFGFSTGMPPEPSARWDPAASPFVHLCAGTLEHGFHQATEAWAGWLHLQQVPFHFTERVAGHDLIQWCEELPQAVARAWG